MRIGRGRSTTPARSARLARVLDDPVQRKQVLAGKTVQEVVESNKPARQQLSEGLVEVHTQLSRIYQLLGEGSVKQEDAEDSLETAKRVRNLAVQVHKSLHELATGEDEE